MRAPFYLLLALALTLLCNPSRAREPKAPDSPVSSASQSVPMLAFGYSSPAVVYLDDHEMIRLGPFMDAYGEQFKDGFAVIKFIAEGNRAYRCGAIDTDGRFVIEPRYDLLEDRGGGYFVGSKQARLSIIEAASGKTLGILPADCTRVGYGDISPDKPIPCDFARRPIASSSGNWGYCDITGRIVIQPQFSQASSFEADRAKVNSEGAGTIDSSGRFGEGPNKGEIWNGGVRQITSSVRMTNFADALAKYDFIGMSDSKLISILGPTAGPIRPMGVPYSKPAHSVCFRQGPFAGGCGNAAQGLEFEIDENKKVRGWRCTSLGGVGPWVRENVAPVRTMERVIGTDGLVPKSDFAALNNPPH